jgi:hypothetical protein
VQNTQWVRQFLMLSSEAVEQLQSQLMKTKKKEFVSQQARSFNMADPDSQAGPFDHDLC